MDTLNLINQSIYLATKRLDRNIGLEMTIDNDDTLIYLIIEHDGDIVGEFYDIYQAISYINQMEL